MNYFTILRISILCCVLFSCRPKQENVEVNQKNLIEEELMVTILTESYLTEGATSLNIKNVRFEKFDSAYAFNPIKENKVDRAKFDSTIVYYTRHPKLFKKLLDKVVAKLETIERQGKLK